MEHEMEEEDEEENLERVFTADFNESDVSDIEVCVLLSLTSASGKVLTCLGLPFSQFLLWICNVPWLYENFIFT